jgi:hypothetical protein
MSFCPICSAGMRQAFEAQVLFKYSALYDVCEKCGFLRAQQPHWLEEAYSSAIASADTGLVMRNVSLAFKVASTLYWVFGERGDGQYHDSAGGYGILTRIMRDLGFNFYWSDAYCENLMARGFEYSPAVGDCEAVTAMEVMEHLTDPLTYVENTLKESGADSLIFTTELYEGAPPTADWWYYAFSTGQHIGFFRQSTLEILGRRLGLQFISANGLHILSRRQLSESKFFWASRPWVSKGSAVFIRRRFGSKTMSDHLKMLHPD